MCIDRRLRELGGKKSFVEYFDFVGGTSTGGILAMALAKGTSLDHLNGPPAFLSSGGGGTYAPPLAPHELKPSMNGGDVLFNAVL